MFNYLKESLFHLSVLLSSHIKMMFDLYTFLSLFRRDYENALLIDLSLTNTQLFSSQDVNWVDRSSPIGWTVCITRGLFVFISCLDSHFEGAHSLLRIHWWASDVMLNFQICSDEGTNSCTSWLIILSKYYYILCKRNFLGELFKMISDLYNKCNGKYNLRK